MNIQLGNTRLVRLMIGACLLAAAGCSSSVSPVDPDAARTTLANTLDAWKAGKKPTDLRTLQPEIVVGESFWDTGRKLASYAIDGSGEADERGNLRVPVTLTLKTAKSEEKIKANYIVTVEPTATVYREFEE